jgi:ComF family protein
MRNQWLKSIQSGLMPPVCVLCGDPGHGDLDLCAPCRHELPRHTATCPRCGAALGAQSALASLCGGCLRNPPPFQRVWAPLVYAPPVDHLIQGLKFHGRLELARLLGSLLATWLKPRLDSLPDRVVPVPLHPSRLRERGFNQAVELGREICRALGIAMDTCSCRRRRATAPQSTLAAHERATNIKGAFEVKGRVHGTVAIIDDVMTTGNTVAELARCLLAAGASQVEIWVCART